MGIHVPLASLHKQVRRTMKIHEQPRTEHLQLETTRHEHISKTRAGYRIRKTIQGTTYYYGVYKTLQEAISIEKQLNQHGYTPRISKQHNTRRGQEYTKWLKHKILGK